MTTQNVERRIMGNPAIAEQHPIRQQQQRDLDVEALIDDAPVGRLQHEVFFLCFLIAMLEGFDTQCVAFVAPSLTAHWQVSPASFGPIFSATLLGSVIGVALVGPLADRYGRRWFTIVNVAIFGFATLASAWSDSVGSLIFCRLIAGLGLGGALPNFMALTAEYAPLRTRATIVAMTLWGYPFGAVFGGLLSAPLIVHFGWRSVFVAGGVATLLLVPILLARLPESVRFLAARESHHEAARRVLRRIVPSGRCESSVRLRVPATAPASAMTYRLLFAPGLAANTILYATSMFMGLLLSYLLVSWIPMLLRQAGMSVQDAVFGSVTFNFAGIVGSYVLTRRVDTTGRPLQLLIGTYCASALAVAAIGAVGASFWPVMASIFLAGFLLIGTQMTLSAHVASSYPTTVRATAVGWLHGVGRCGSLIGPVAAGTFVAMGMQPPSLFAIASVAALLAATALAIRATIGSPLRTPP